MSEPVGRRALLRGALALALGGGAWTRVASLRAQSATVPVDVYAVGETATGIFLRSLRDALHGLPIELTVRRAPSLASVPTPGRSTLCLAVRRDDDSAEVMRCDANGEAALLRRVPLRGRLDATARAAIGHVVRTAVESALATAHRGR